MIEEGSSIGFVIGRPANSVLNISRVEKFMTFLNLPHLFKTDSIKLRVFIFS